jgi:pimeloyl-ACP methyl ester carboxylesterase
MRPNWETVLRPILDFACARAEIASERIAVMGWSFGGFLAPRAVAGEQRVAALIADPGQWDQLDAIRAALPLPTALKERLPNVEPAELDRYLTHLSADPLVRWRLIQRGLWVNGLDTLGQYVVAMSDYRISDVVETITCPTFVACAENDPIAANAKYLYDALRCPKVFVRFTSSEGADGHCEAWNRSRFDQKVFDWLDNVIGPRG